MFSINFDIILILLDTNELKNYKKLKVVLESGIGSVVCVLVVGD